jgi:hypothetical protein
MSAQPRPLPLTPERLRERVVAFFDREAQTNTANSFTDEEWALIVAKAYAAGWLEGGGEFDPLTMLDVVEGGAS